ncbi:MAG: hypothetical protein CL679_01910 [Bermanella sp.]|nr:hypothetical protein [Bermanella sp.]|tara:strand:- start:4287 stop:5417 length:1131 start_codon:yes stop_codon:yes gene_type:complete
MLSFNSALFNKSNLYSQPVQPRVMAEENLDQDKFANQRLGQALKDNLGVDMPPEKTVNENKSVFDIDAVIDTVMQQVGKRIDQARLSGASDDDLQSMFDAARSGVETGFKQAREQIDAINKLNEPLAEKIDAAEQGIYDGIDELEENTFNPQAEIIKANTVEYAKAYERTNNSFEFELTTQEGDVVKIKVMSNYESYQEALSASGNGKELYASYSEQNNSSGFNLLVKGDLNDDEMAAIESLMSQVNDLADEFYTGDLGTAFDMAMNLTSDADQIAQFSLDLKQSQVSAYEYGAMKGEALGNNGKGYETAKLPKGLADPLANFAQGVKEAYEEASQFANSRSLLENLFEQMDQTTQALGKSQLPDLLKPMLNAMSA